jgi:glucose/arabinose dehydrogenase
MIRRITSGLLFSALLSCVCIAPAQAPLRLETVATGLARPVLITAPPGDLERLFVVGQAGRVSIIRNGAVLPTPFLDLSATVGCCGEMGVLGLAFHPNFATNRHCYVFHTTWPPHAYVRRFTVQAGNPDVVDPASAVTILDTPLVYGNHNGGMLAFGRDGYLYVSLGDGGALPGQQDPMNYAQRTDNLLGKILRLDVDNPSPPRNYGIPPSNPFAGPGAPLDEIWAYGLRNPWRFSFDRLTGDCYIADVGGINEEIDFEPFGAPGGRNYGWSCMAGTFCNNLPVCVCNAPALTMPLHEYSSLQPAGAVIGGYVYRGVAMPSWRGAYFYADYMLNKVWALRHNGTAVTQVIDVTPQLVPPAPFTLTLISAFGEDAFGELYITVLGGQVYRIAPVTPALAGLVPYGSGTPGCSGAHSLSADSSPVLGNPTFRLRTTNAPGPGIGLTAFADQADVNGTDPGLGFLAHVQITSPSLLLLLATSDSAGVSTFTFPIPTSMSLSGLQLCAQSLWLWPPAVCTPSAQGWSSSPGLQITLLP